MTEILGQVLTEDPEGITARLNNETVQQEIIDGAAEEGIEIIPSRFVVGEGDDGDDGSCDLMWEVRDGAMTWHLRDKRGEGCSE